MKWFKMVIWGMVCFIFVFGCGEKKETKILPDLPDGVQAISLLGDTLYASSPYAGGAAMKNFTTAKADYDADPRNADNIIWYGRRNAYLGKYREAIKIFTEGIKKHPEDARMYRHRGHRYITLREYDRAIIDFELAAKLINGTEDVIETDGQPNAQNIPVSSLHQNIWYHLGLAYYVKNDMENALRVYRKGIESSLNDDMLAATTHWLYMTLRRMGKDEDAKQCLEPIKKEMNIIENQAYHNLCLLYKSEVSTENLSNSEFSSIMNDAADYGIGNWYYYNGDKEKAKEIFEKLLKQKGWASFGYLAAESDYSRM